MPTDETRRLLKVFGVAVTAFEDAVDKGASAEERKKAEAEVRSRLEEVTALIERLGAKKS
jgi:translation initiation factor 2 alpha subunit (eIF-2alpha)